MRQASAILLATVVLFSAVVAAAGTSAQFGSGESSTLFKDDFEDGDAVEYINETEGQTGCDDSGDYQCFTTISEDASQGTYAYRQKASTVDGNEIRSETYTDKSWNYTGNQTFVFDFDVKGEVSGGITPGYFQIGLRNNSSGSLTADHLVRLRWDFIEHQWELRGNLVGNNKNFEGPHSANGENTNIAYTDVKIEVDHSNDSVHVSMNGTEYVVADIDASYYNSGQEYEIRTVMYTHANSDITHNTFWDDINVEGKEIDGAISSGSSSGASSDDTYTQAFLIASENESFVDPADTTLTAYYWEDASTDAESSAISLEGGWVEHDSGSPTEQAVYLDLYDDTAYRLEVVSDAGDTWAWDGWVSDADDCQDRFSAECEKVLVLSSPFDEDTRGGSGSDEGTGSGTGDPLVDPDNEVERPGSGGGTPFPSPVDTSTSTPVGGDLHITDIQVPDDGVPVGSEVTVTIVAERNAGVSGDISQNVEVFAGTSTDPPSVGEVGFFIAEGNSQDSETISFVVDEEAWWNVEAGIQSAYFKVGQTAPTSTPLPTVTLPEGETPGTTPLPTITPFQQDPYLQTGIMWFPDDGRCVGLKYYDPAYQTDSLSWNFKVLGTTYSGTKNFDEPVGYFETCIDPLGSENMQTIPPGATNGSDLPGADGPGSTPVVGITIGQPGGDFGGQFPFGGGGGDQLFPSPGTGSGGGLFVPGGGSGGGSGGSGGLTPVVAGAALAGLGYWFRADLLALLGVLAENARERVNEFRNR